MFELARRLVLEHGWNTTCYQIVNSSMERWFSSRNDAVVGFVRQSGIRVVAGAPICDPSRLADVVAEFERADANSRVCYFGAESRLFNLLRGDPAYSIVTLGAQPVWSPNSWGNAIRFDPSLRAQLNRAVNKGVTVEEWPASQATQSPELKRCLSEWLTTRGLPTMHFLVEPETLDNLEDRRIFVAQRAGQVIAFVTLSPVPCQSGWLTEQFVRGFAAPNGTIELTLNHAIRAVAESGAKMITMGIVPLSAHVDAGDLPGWLRAAIPWVRMHGRRFYNFEGLDAFKSKFRPDRWEPIHIISREPKFSPSSLHAIASAFTDGNPGKAVLTGIGQAVKQELRWLIDRSR